MVKCDHRRTLINFGTIIVAFAFCQCCQGQSLDCIAEMTVPRYSLSSRRSTRGGDVAATVSIGVDGRPSSIDLRSDDTNLAEEVQVFLSRHTTYASNCAGKKVELMFTFRLEGEAEINPPVWVRFRPPNHFIIVSRPRLPIVH